MTCNQRLISNIVNRLILFLFILESDTDVCLVTFQLRLNVGDRLHYRVCRIVRLHRSVRSCVR